MRSSALVVGALLLLLNPSCQPTSNDGLPIITLELGGQRLKAEVARSEAEQARGLMYRRELAPNRAMLFVYEEDRRLSFWMKNTFIPLSIAYLEADGTIAHIEDMHPQTLESHPSPVPVRYALEVNQGWFDANGIAPGSKVVFELPK